MDFTLKEKSNNVLDFSPLAGKGIYFMYMAITRLSDGSRHIIQDWGNPGPQVDLNKFARGEAYRVDDLRLWGIKGFYYRMRDPVVFGESRDLSTEILDGYRKAYENHVKWEERHKTEKDTAKKELRPVGNLQHKQAEEAHQEAKSAYADAIQAENDGALHELNKLTKKAEKETREALDSDDVFPPFEQSKGWESFFDHSETYANWWNSSDRHRPVLTISEGVIELKVPREVLKKEYRTRNSKNWKSFSKLQDVAHTIGKEWKGFDLEIRLNGNNADRMIFRIEELPKRLNVEDLALEAMEKLEKEEFQAAVNHLGLACDAIRKKRNEEKEILAEVKESAIWFSRDDIWEAFKKILPPTFFQALKEKMNPKADDNRFLIPPKHLAKKILTNCKVYLHKYVEDIYDCENSADDAKNKPARKFGVNFLGVIRDNHKQRGSQHAYNVVFYHVGGKLFAELYEPQKNRFIPENEHHQGLYKMSGADVDL